MRTRNCSSRPRKKAAASPPSLHRKVEAGAAGARVSAEHPTGREVPPLGCCDAAIQTKQLTHSQSYVLDGHCCCGWTSKRSAPGKACRAGRRGSRRSVPACVEAESAPAKLRQLTGRLQSLCTLLDGGSCREAAKRGCKEIAGAPEEKSSRGSDRRFRNCWMDHQQHGESPHHALACPAARPSVESPP